MRNKGTVIDINKHPYLLADVCDPAKDEAFAIEVTGLYHSGISTAESVFVGMDCAKINMGVLSPLDLTTTRGRVLVTNEQTAELEQKYPDYFLGFASVDPQRKDAADVLEHAFGDLKLHGLHLFPALQGFSPNAEFMEPIYDLCEKYDRPILFDCGCSPYPGLTTEYAHPLLLEKTAVKRKDLRICLSRFGWPWTREVCMLMLKCHNVYTDTSLVYLDDARQMYHQMFMVEMGPKWIDRSFRHQVMFGSGSPGLEQMRMVNAIRDLDFRPGTIENILGNNAREFLGFEKGMRWLND